MTPLPRVVAWLGWLVLGALPAPAAASPPLVSPVDRELDGPGATPNGVCFWTEPQDPSRSLLFVTGREAGSVQVFDPGTGELVATMTGFLRPVDCAADGELLLTTDPQAGVVRVHHLPDLAFVRGFGHDMDDPQGIAVLHPAAGQSLAYVTDAFDGSVHVYNVATGSLIRVFASDLGRRIGPIVADDRHQRILLAREPGDGVGGIGLFTADGTLVRDLGGPVFAGDTRGLALYACGDAGYLLAADHGPEATELEVFDRVTLDHVATFRVADAGGNPTDGGAGLALLQSPWLDFPAGLLAASDAAGGDEPGEVDWSTGSGSPRSSGSSGAPAAPSPSASSRPAPAASWRAPTPP